MVKKLLAITLGLVFITALLVVADEKAPAERPAWMDKERPAKKADVSELAPRAPGSPEQLSLKWRQDPDLSTYGMDVSAYWHEFYLPHVLADDFLCTTTGPILEIHVFGSWWHDYLPFYDNPSAVDFRLSIHADIPDPDGPGPGYSQPGELLWIDVPRFDVYIHAMGLREGWFEPPAYYTPDGDEICWEYVFYLAPDDFIQQGTPLEPVIYWLDVQAYSYDPDAFFGWKTSTDHWNDDGCWAPGVDGQGLDWYELRYYPPHPWAGESIDLAFEIWGEEAEVRDTVECEPQGGQNPNHPPTYWYDVTPGDFGRCDFHVLVGDSIATNYSNVSLPYDSWTWQLHKVGSDWWFSWYDPGCDTAIFSTTRFQFDNPNAAIWGHWTTTIDGSSNPFAQVIDSSWNHTGEMDGYGYRVHVPEAVPAAEWDHKMHYPQLPDEAGWDVYATYPTFVADDFRCMENGYIKDIHFWGSWVEGLQGDLYGFLIGIWSDLPADISPTGHSMPRDLLYMWDSPPFKWTSIQSPTPEGFYWPGEGYATNDHFEYFRYDVLIDSAQWFWQDSGTVYWLSISAGVVGTQWWGWKSSQDHWNDDGVWARWTGGEPAWVDMYEPPEFTQSLDLAFVITGDCCIGITGNVDNDPGHVIDIGDVTALLDYLYIRPGVEPPECIEEANVDGDPGQIVDIGDVTALLDYLYIRPGVQPPAPCP